MALFVAGLMVLIAFSATANAFAMQPAPQKQSADASISGTVTTLMGNPVSGATVYYGGGGVAEGQLELAWGSVSTDENGDYIIDNLPGGIFGLFVVKSGHTPNGRIVRLDPGENLENVDFNLISLSPSVQMQQQSAPLSI